jgi:exodeoxyribonuclease V beta subunit
MSVQEPTFDYCRPTILDEILDGGHKVIDASAGTGKTFTIERIVIELLLTGVARVDQILVVTFTEKATAELRARIRATIEDVMSGRCAGGASSADRRRLGDSERERLKSALFSFHHAPIHTIHSFCHRMLTELAFDSGMRFGLDLTSGRAEFHEALRAELRERLKSDTRIDRLVAEWLSDDTYDALEALLWQAHSQRYLRTAGGLLNQEALTFLINAFDSDALADAFRIAAIRDDARDTALAATRELETIINRAEGSIETLADSLRDFDLDRICNPKSARRTRNEKRPTFPDQMRQKVRAIVDAAQRTEAALAIEQRVVDQLLPPVVARMDARKRERGTLDYEDMLGWLANALDSSRGKPLAATLRDRYRVTLIDEFQDTDQLQWKIFRRVFVDDNASNTLYVIGDPKQAIYGFRGADVHAYLEARAQLSESGAATANLRKNFRSTADVIKMCNLIFDQNAAPPLFNGQIKYDPPAECGRPALRAIIAGGEPVAPVALLKFAPPDERHKFSRRMREAVGRRIADAIRRIVCDAEHAIWIHDDGTEPRKVTARDIFVLTRAGRDGVEISKYLRDAGVPFAFYKQDGLFQTREAAYILDVLRGIDEPGRRSNRLKAWASPFFAVDYSDLARLDDEHNAQPMVDRLFEWRAMAEGERFAELFDALIDRSGLAGRLLLSDRRRELTNYEHLFEILTHAASRRGVSLSELIDLLDAWIAQRATPAGKESDPNIQRVEDDRDAVQIMTIHKSKGLQADVVALYGGFFANNQREPVCVYHCGNERRLAIGKRSQSLHDEELKREQAEEDQRLLYVALTRARARLFLPYIPAGTLKRDINGCYQQLNDRLRVLDGEAQSQTLFTIEIATAPPSESPDKKPKAAKPLDDEAVCRWLASTTEPAFPEQEFTDLRKRHSALITESYTSLQAADSEDFKNSIDVIDAQADNPDLPGGRRVGIFLHEAIERLDFNSFGDMPDFESWMARHEVRDLFANAMRRHGVSDSRWLNRGREIVFNALTSPVALGDTLLESGLHKLPKVSEMEFIYPIPEADHARLGNGPDGSWTVGRGYIKGFIDLVFRYGDLMYFADWKGDLLPSYEPNAVASHVDAHYRLQARIYSVGVLRMLRIHSALDYDAKFGGLLYVFLRGVSRTGNGKSGLYFARPSWDEILTYESELLSSKSQSEQVG